MTPTRNGKSPDLEKKIVILGAGPTGLGAGYRLNELGYRNWAIYERNPYIAGLATSFTDDAGFTYDIGGHVMFSHYKYFDDLVDKLMGDNYTEIMRQAWIWIMDRFVPYPFQNNIRYLPPEVVHECVMGLIEAHRDPQKVGEAVTFDELIDAQFGPGIARYFMKPYNFKVWAHPTTHMSRTWLGERVAMPNLERVIKNVLLSQDDAGWGPNNKFKYPLRGGTGGLYAPMITYVGDHLHLNRAAVHVDNANKQVHFSDGEVVDYDLLLTTMPLDLLVGRLSDAPESVRQATRGLHHSSGLIVGVGINRPVPSDKCWLYFPETNTPFYRVTYLSNYSPYLTPDENHFSLLAETSYSPHKHESKHDIIDRVVEGFLNAKLMEPEDLERIRSTYLIDVDYSYPVPTVDRDAALAEIQPFLMSQDIFSRGRFGAWEYEIGNMDHSVMQGVEVVNRWLHDEPEQTWIDYSLKPGAQIPAERTDIPVFESTSGHGVVSAGPKDFADRPKKQRQPARRAKGGTANSKRQSGVERQPVAD